MEHVYSKDRAQQILDAFPADKLDELIVLAGNAKQNHKLIESHELISLPDGWAYQMYANCVVAAYQDGDQERRAFFVPRIWIDFLYVDTIEMKKSVLERLPLGYCSCGKRMPVMQLLFWALDLVKRKGFWSFPLRVIGQSIGFILGIYLILNPIHRYSLLYNRHPSCL